jgi:hypothetical protein
MSGPHVGPAILDVLDEAEEFCYFVTPFYEPWEYLRKRMAIASRKKIKVVFVLKNVEEKLKKHYAGLIEELEKDFGFEVHFIDNLHAKVYLNEKHCLITSMNLYDYSQRTNFETGYRIDDPAECKAIEAALVKEIKNNELPQSGSETGSRIDDPAECEAIETAPVKEIKDNEALQSGDLHKFYCIRCGTGIEKEKPPYCGIHLAEWSKWHNHDYPESFCLVCGEPKSGITVKKPRCDECYTKSLDKST